MKIEKRWLNAINQGCVSNGYTIGVMGAYEDWTLPDRRSIEGRVKVGARKLRELDYEGGHVRDIGVWPNGLPDETALRHQAMMVVDLIEQKSIHFKDWATDMFICMVVYRRKNFGPAECKTAILTIDRR